MTSEPTAGVLIVGGGQAAVQLAISLRHLGADEPITILSEEQRPPYQRPPLSKAYLLGAVNSESLEFRSEEFYARERIAVRTEHRVLDVRLPADGEPGVATCDNGTTLEFSRLALATGSRPRRLTVPGAELDGVCYLRDLADATELKERMQDAERVLVVGGGFIGLEAAAVARSRGKDVTVVEASDRLVGRVVSPLVSDFYREAHERRGTRLLLGASIERIEGRAGRVAAAHLDGGERVAIELIVVGIGVEPRVELARQLGLEVDNGIVVDEFARTSDPRVVAVGDCAATPHPSADGLVRLESVGHAVDHAKCAAAALTGAPVSYDAVPWFWSDQDTLKLQIAGLSGGFDQTVLRGDPGEERFSVFYFRDQRLIAVNSINSPRDYMAVRRALTTGHRITPEAAADADNPLRPAPADL
ncbi:FAD-dependent oxidoreductase [Nocardioides sp. cx-169]|uniref:NAD(P)/FAD-dependent oxidoreductase n=1 Tax=Nocardioides sp. cx-169 TaxID=2899080 RepID=UPI001E2C4A8E|nr:FAD-dependent oxidoreductase [Nocardioides sp. cx-169]MCD4533639.1 FAD-dependent oxidoreductase [Nocardioides sp. cx-169]